MGRKENRNGNMDTKEEVKPTALNGRKNHFIDKTFKLKQTQNRHILESLFTAYQYHLEKKKKKLEIHEEMDRNIAEITYHCIITIFYFEYNI